MDRFTDTTGRTGCESGPDYLKLSYYITLMALLILLPRKSRTNPWEQWQQLRRYIWQKNLCSTVMRRFWFPSDWSFIESSSLHKKKNNPNNVIVVPLLFLPQWSSLQPFVVNLVWGLDCNPHSSTTGSKGASQIGNCKQERLLNCPIHPISSGKSRLEVPAQRLTSQDLHTVEPLFQCQHRESHPQKFARTAVDSLISGPRSLIHPLWSFFSLSMRSHQCE